MAAIKAKNVKITKQDEKKWNIFFNEYFPAQWLNKFTVDVWNLYGATEKHLVELLIHVSNALNRYNMEIGKTSLMVIRLCSNSLKLWKKRHGVSFVRWFTYSKVLTNSQTTPSLSFLIYLKSIVFL